MTRYLGGKNAKRLMVITVVLLVVITTLNIIIYLLENELDILNMRIIKLLGTKQENISSGGDKGIPGALQVSMPYTSENHVILVKNEDSVIAKQITIRTVRVSK